MNSALAVALRWMRPLAFRGATVDLRGFDEEMVDDLVDLLDDLLEEGEEL